MITVAGAEGILRPDLGTAWKPKMVGSRTGENRRPLGFRTHWDLGPRVCRKLPAQVGLQVSSWFVPHHANMWPEDPEF